ncbi:TetR/AcrR family transcriptional regulator [Hyphobacterium sp.]|jgi:AcrR family transcriptional regulator|uniref:TetR/AcrR family transcriptional regulator n=1 Tax=Hyphobacterium sp. TaxID=2004662 RepID=UPI003BAB3A02
MSANKKVQPLPSRAARKARTRGAILEAAADVFAGRGYDGGSLPDIAQRAGVNVPLIVYHFGSKRELWQAAVDHVYARFQTCQEEGLKAAAGLSGRAFFRAVIRASLRALVAEPRYMRILFQESVAASPRLTWLVETHQRQMSDQTIALIEAAQAEGLIAKGDPAHLKYLVSGALSLPITFAPEYEVLTGRSPLTPDALEDHIDLCMAILFRGAE